MVDDGKSLPMLFELIQGDDGLVWLQSAALGVRLDQPCSNPQLVEPLAEWIYIELCLFPLFARNS